MNCSHKIDCMGNYDFSHITYYAKKRFVDGCDTLSLLKQATSECEREEIALVCMLDIEDDIIRDIGLSCIHAGQCNVTDCRARLKAMIQEDLEQHN